MSVGYCSNISNMIKDTIVSLFDSLDIKPDFP